MGGPRRCRQPPLACGLGACGSLWPGVGLWGVRPGDSRSLGPVRAGPGGAGSGPELQGAHATLGRPHRRSSLVCCSLHRSPRTQGGRPVSSGSAHLRASYQDRASLPPVVYAALHSFCPSLDRHRPLRRKLSRSWGGPVRANPGWGRLCWQRVSVLLSWPRRAAVLPNPGKQRRLAYLFFFCLNLVMKCPGFL